MGQYHILVNLDKKEYIHPHKLGTGLKLWEQIGTYHGPGAALIALLACSNGRGGGDLLENDMIGRWAGDRIAIIGDYGEDHDLDAEHEASTLYSRCEDEDSGEFEDISDLIIPVLEHACNVRFSREGYRRVHDLSQTSEQD